MAKLNFIILQTLVTLSFRNPSKMLIWCSRNMLFSKLRRIVVLLFWETMMHFSMISFLKVLRTAFIKKKIYIYIYIYFD